MEFLPVFLDIKQRKCLLVGGGQIAIRKANLLVRAGAVIHGVSHHFDDELLDLLKQGQHSYRQGDFEPGDIEGSVLAVAATDNKRLNQQVAKAGRENNIPVNVVDQPELCTMIFPAIVDRSPVVVAISTSGASPILGRRIKEQLEVNLSQETGNLARLLRSFRGKVKSKFTDFASRARFWEQVLDSHIVELAYAGNLDEAGKQIESALEASDDAPGEGEVYLVGAGPGDPDLLTLRALRLMQKADVVLYDRLVSKEILARIRPDAEKYHVGKERSKHLVPQETINDMLVRFAGEGKRVLRLKGGDPFIFGRGGEEMSKLIEHNVKFQIVPGITAASGCASYAGIPLTHRDCSASVQFLTGHFNKQSEQPDWSLIAKGGQTLVFYMGLLNLSSICEQLIAHGMSAQMPAALIQKGTTKEQVVVTGKLENLAEAVSEAGLEAPTLLIVGEVVKLRQSLAWFKTDSQSL